MNNIFNCAVKNRLFLTNFERICRYCHVANVKNTKNIKKGNNGHYDIIIVGGGAIGLSMACSIVKNSKLCDRKVLVLDGAPKFKGYNADKYSNRVFSLNEGTVNLLKSLNAWDTITSIRYQPIKQMQVWDALSDAYISFNHEDFSTNVAYVVENDVILHAILSELDRTNVTIEYQSKIDQISLANNTTAKCFIKSNEKQYSCDLLIGADGANSIVRKQMRVENVSLSYDQMGLIATVEIKDLDNNDVAWQRFLPDGVIALLPLNNRLSSIVWSTDTVKVKKLLTLPEEEFIDAVNDAFWTKHAQDEIVKNVMKGVMSLVGCQRPAPSPLNIKAIYERSRAAFPLGFGHCSSYVARGTALIGDSAHRVHPLAGQGLNLGFGDVIALTDELAKAAYDGQILGDIQHLCAYEQQRLMHNVPIMLGIHGLQRLYGTTFSPIVLLRSVGLQMIHTLTPVKKLFMEKAMH